MTDPAASTDATVRDVETTNRVIAGPHGPLRLRTYMPTSGPQTSGLVWVHGGAYMAGDIDMPEADWVSQTLAGAGISVVSVDYQLAPIPDWAAASTGLAPRNGVHYPVASEEVTAAFLWASARRSHTRWSLGGASAGGNLAASAALRLRDGRDAPPASLVLAYPLAHARLPDLRPELARKVAELPEQERFTSEMVEAFSRNYIANDADYQARYAFPGGQDLQGLPPTFILNSDNDSLRSSGEALGSELAAAGVDLLMIRERHTHHGHLNEPHNPAAATSITRITRWLTDITPL